MIDEEILDLRKCFSERAFGFLEYLAKAALLDPSEKCREVAVDKLGQINKGFIKSGMVGDNQLYFVVGIRPDKDMLAYVCDLPEEYEGMKIEQTYSFTTKQQ